GFFGGCGRPRVVQPAAGCSVAEGLGGGEEPVVGEAVFSGVGGGAGVGLDFGEGHEGVPAGFEGDVHVAPLFGVAGFGEAFAGDGLGLVGVDVHVVADAFGGLVLVDHVRAHEVPGGVGDGFGLGRGADDGVLDHGAGCEFGAAGGGADGDFWRFDGGRELDGEAAVAVEFAFDEPGARVGEDAVVLVGVHEEAVDVLAVLGLVVGHLAADDVGAGVLVA